MMGTGGKPPTRRPATLFAGLLAFLCLVIRGWGVGLEVKAGEAALTLSSAAFRANGPIPARYTCDGANISPPLAWRNVPPGTRSLALIVEDPDAPDPQAPRMTWVHWVVYNLPPNSTELAEDARLLPEPGRQGKNDWQRLGYGGPCPPIGRHRYFFKLYALDITLPQTPPLDKAAVKKWMQGHLLAQATLIGTYKRPNN